MNKSSRRAVLAGMNSTPYQKNIEGILAPSRGLLVTYKAYGRKIRHIMPRGLRS